MIQDLWYAYWLRKIKAKEVCIIPMFIVFSYTGINGHCICIILRCSQIKKNIQQNLIKYAPPHIHKVLQELTTQEAIAVSRKCCCQVLLIVDNLISHFLDQFDQLTTRWTSDKKKQGRGFDCRVNCRLFIFYVFTAGLLFHFHSFYSWLLYTCIFCSFWTAPLLL